MLKKFEGSRTIYGAYHILKGKKTSQTIQDCRLFELTSFFGVHKEMDRAEVLEIRNQLIQNDYIRPFSENRFKVTAIGLAYLEEKITKAPFPKYLNGFVYKDVDEIFWARIVLLTQCLVHVKAGVTQFAPIIKNARVQLWVKDKLRNSDVPTTELARRLYQELDAILKEFSEEEASMFVLRLSGLHRVGLTINQIAEELNMEKSYTKLAFKGVLHGIMKKANDSPELFPTIHSIIGLSEEINVLTDTTQKTYKLLQKGLNLEEISTKRMLKPSTVEDHVVEVALHLKEFSIDRFVSQEKQAAIMRVVKKVGTKRLREIKEECNEATTYFEIRLTLAKKGV